VDDHGNFREVCCESSHVSPVPRVVVAFLDGADIGLVSRSIPG
jgi:hypothetical protein